MNSWDLDLAVKKQGNQNRGRAGGDHTLETYGGWGSHAKWEQMQPISSWRALTTELSYSSPVTAELSEGKSSIWHRELSPFPTWSATHSIKTLYKSRLTTRTEGHVCHCATCLFHPELKLLINSELAKRWAQKRRTELWETKNVENLYQINPSFYPSTNSFIHHSITPESLLNILHQIRGWV